VRACASVGEIDWALSNFGVTIESGRAVATFLLPLACWTLLARGSILGTNISV
jgi:hypothetical protein